MVVTYSKSMDQSGKVANPARDQLNRKKIIFPCPRSRLKIWSRETGPAVPSRVSLLISILRRNLVLTYRIPPEFRGGVHLFILNHHTPSGHAIAYQWHSLPRVRRHRASQPQGSSERVLPRQVTMDQLICASLSHTHYWYEVGILKVAANDRWMFLCTSCDGTTDKILMKSTFIYLFLYPLHNSIFNHLRAVVYNLYKRIFSTGAATVKKKTVTKVLLPIEIRVTDTLRASGDAQTHTFTLFFVSPAPFLSTICIATMSFAGYHTFLFASSVCFPCFLFPV